MGLCFNSFTIQLFNIVHTNAINWKWEKTAYSVWYTSLSHMRARERERAVFSRPYIVNEWGYNPASLRGLSNGVMWLVIWGLGTSCVWGLGWEGHWEFSTNIYPHDTIINLSNRLQMGGNCLHLTNITVTVYESDESLIMPARSTNKHLHTHTLIMFTYPYVICTQLSCVAAQRL